MKKFILLLSLVALIGTMSCKDDDESGSYVGVWESNKVTTRECDNPTDNDDQNRACDDTRCYRLELNADGTFAFQEGLPVRTGTWTVGGDLTLCVEEDGEQVCESYRATVNSTTLTLATTNENTGCIITQIFIRQFDTPDDQEA
ncbi:hypothetical protein [Ekhidna sp.]|uniref:hypothetical protein n=1 Tax=Ekhidna sp. TaxID=2608089 RepID=UPI003CCB9316